MKKTIIPNTLKFNNEHELTPEIYLHDKKPLKFKVKNRLEITDF